MAWAAVKIILSTSPHWCTVFGHFYVARGTIINQFSNTTWHRLRLEVVLLRCDLCIYIHRCYKVNIGSSTNHHYLSGD